MQTEQPTKKYREILDDFDDVIVRWETPGQTEEGAFVEARPAGEKDNLLYEFTRADNSTFKCWETCVLKRKLDTVQPGDVVEITYLGTKRKTKLFQVRVVEEA